MASNSGAPKEPTDWTGGREGVPLSVQDSLQLLRRIVEQRSASGQSVRSATIKPLMMVRGFDQSAYGFASFRDFLLEAERQKQVSLVQAPVGPDVDVLPFGVARARYPEKRVERRIRVDVWRAFIEWTPGRTRLYDRQTDSVVILMDSGEDAASLEGIREALESDPDRFVSISPITAEDTFQWMLQFTEALPPGDAKVALGVAIRSRRPFRDFNEAAREGGVASQWRVVRLSRTRQVIEDWARTNGLEIDLYKEMDQQRESRETTKAIPERTKTQRERILHALGRMSTAELLRIPIPAELLLGDDGGSEGRS